MPMRGEDFCSLGKASPELSDCSNVSLAGGMELLATAVGSRQASDLLQKMQNAADANDPFWHLLMSEWTNRDRMEPAGDIHGTRRLEIETGETMTFHGSWRKETIK
jgi:hypothetical protein